MGVPITYNLRNLIERKGTTLMTALGIGLTVAVLVTAVALTEGLKAVFSGSGDARHMIILRKGTDAELTSSVSNEAYQIIRRMPGIAAGADGEPLVSPEGLSVVALPNIDNPDVNMNVTIRGMLPIGLAMRSVKIEQGQAFEPGRRQVVVGKAIAQRYPAARIGNRIAFGKGAWEVVGVFSAGGAGGGGGGGGSAADSEIWLDLDQLRGDFERGGEANSLLLRLQDPAAMKALAKTIEDDQRLGVKPIGEKEYYAALTNSETSIFLQSLGYAVAVIMAVGSAFAATNTMYAAVSRRSREIGTLRALGFSRGSILRSFMLESICLSLLGGIAGVLLAFPINGMTTGVGNFQTFSDVAFQFKVGPAAILVGLIFSAVIGALGGFLPAWAAARKDIVQAMRDS
jgi:ABC-type lipoprotein release transport system permease subunit